MNSEAVNFRTRRTSTNFRWSFRISVIALGRLLISHASFAGETRRLTLAEAVRLVVEQNLTLKIARLKVKENEYKKDADRPDYFPTITTQSSAVHISELQTLTTPQGAFGVVSGVPVPAQNTNLPPGKQTLYSSGTMIAQPLTQLLRIHQENRAAAAAIASSRDELRRGENEVALQVHTLYYGILVAQMQKKAAEQETAFASETLRENENDVQGGSALAVSAIQGRASLLESQQAVLTAIVLNRKICIKPVIWSSAPRTVPIDSSNLERPLQTDEEGQGAPALKNSRISHTDKKVLAGLLEGCHEFC